MWIFNWHVSLNALLDVEILKWTKLPTLYSLSMLAFDMLIWRASLSRCITCADRSTRGQYLSSIFTNICILFSKIFVFHYHKYLSSFSREFVFHFHKYLSFIFKMFSAIFLIICLPFEQLFSPVFAIICVPFSQLFVFRLHNFRNYLFFNFHNYLSSIFTIICILSSQLYVLHFHNYLSSVFTIICEENFRQGVSVIKLKLW